MYFIKGYYKWYISGNEDELVNTFNYLGIVFSSGGSFIHTTKTLAGKSLRAMGSLFNSTKYMDVPVASMLNPLDSYVASILNYDCEVWGFNKAENLERVHIHFCKWLINVYLEINRFSLYINRQIRMIKYWLRLYGPKASNCILSTIVTNQRREITRNSNVSNWLIRLNIC